jgi:hypothetical protein
MSAFYRKNTTELFFINSLFGLFLYFNKHFVTRGVVYLVTSLIKHRGNLQSELDTPSTSRRDLDYLKN